jgi:hypothetical protein
MDFSLFYFERKGERTYLRFTRLGVALILVLTVVPLLALSLLVLTRSRVPAPDVNANVRVLPAATPSSSPGKPVIQKAPPLRPPPKTGKQPGYSMPVPSASPTPGENSDERLIPKQQERPPT